VLGDRIAEQNISSDIVYKSSVNSRQIVSSAFERWPVVGISCCSVWLRNVPYYCGKTRFPHAAGSRVFVHMRPTLSIFDRYFARATSYPKFALDPEKE